jgi:hypothetical protein
MKKMFFVLLVVVLSTLKSSDVFGQQFLWSSSKEITNEKFVPIEDVKVKVMEYYDTYDYYVDGSGYDIDSFLKVFKLGTQIGEFKKKMKEKNLNKLILCLKNNTGNGSTISVLILGQKNFDMVSFTNVLVDGVQPISHYSENGKMRFGKWFDTLME